MEEDLIRAIAVLNTRLRHALDRRLRPLGLSEVNYYYLLVISEQPGINQAALMFAPVAVQIPRYFVIVYCGLADNFLANILPLLALPTGVFLVKQFIDQIPDSLIEAALLDGATDFQIMKNIIFPLIKSPLSTVAILSFSSAWNSVEASTYYINNDSLKTFSFYVSTLSNQSGNVVAGAGVSAAASLIMFLPSLILFIILQSRVMNSMVHSGIK